MRWPMAAGTCACVSGCPDGAPFSWQLNIPLNTIRNGSCTGCNILNGVFTLTQDPIGPCSWHDSGSGVVCTGSTVKPLWTVSYSNGVWTLSSGGNYIQGTLTSAAFDCR